MKYTQPYLLGFAFLLVAILLSVGYNEYFDNRLRTINYENIPKTRANLAIEAQQRRDSLSCDKPNGLNEYFHTIGNIPQERIIYDYPSRYGSAENYQRYPNVILPPSVIGCGHRNGACMGGSEIPILNTLPPVDISDQNIAPVNLTVRGFDEGVQQVGTIQKVFGGDNFVFPLFGRRRYRNDNKWDYFVKFGNFGVILPVNCLRNAEELNTNDEVTIQGQKGKYRVTIYDNDIPQYLPFT